MKWFCARVMWWPHRLVLACVTSLLLLFFLCPPPLLTLSALISILAIFVAPPLLGIQYNTYLIDRSPEGFFRVNETQRNDRTEKQQQLLRIPTGQLGS